MQRMSLFIGKKVWGDNCLTARLISIAAVRFIKIMSNFIKNYRDPLPKPHFYEHDTVLKKIEFSVIPGAPASGLGLSGNKYEKRAVMIKFYMEKITVIL